MGDWMETRMKHLEMSWRIAMEKIAHLESRQGELERDLEELKQRVAKGRISTGNEANVQGLNLDVPMQQSYPGSWYASGSGKLPDLDAAKKMDELAKQMEQLKSYMPVMGPLGAMYSPGIAHQPNLSLQLAPPSCPLNTGTWRSFPNPPQYTLIPSQNFQAPAPAKSASITQPSSSKNKLKRPLDPVPSTPNCEYHSGAVGHTTEECPKLKEKVQKLVDEGKLPHGASNPSSKNKKK